MILETKVVVIVGAIGAVGAAVAAAVASMQGAQGITLSASNLIPVFTSVVLFAVGWGIFKNRSDTHQEKIDDHKGRLERLERGEGIPVIDERLASMERRFEEWLKRLEREFRDWRREQSDVQRRTRRESESDPEAD